MKFTDYATLPAANWSSLKQLEPSTGGSPLWCRWCQDHPRADTPAFQLGRATHTAVLEPEEFEGRYVVIDGLLPDGWEDIYQNPAQYAVYPGAVRRGKQWDHFVVDHGEDPRPIILQSHFDKSMEIGRQMEGREPLSRDHYDTAQIIGAAVKASPSSALLVDGQAEVTVQWTDEKTGLDCKCRPDYLRKDMLIDFKTAKRVDPRGFDRAAGDYLYHAQLAFYREGCTRAGLLDPGADVVIIPAQSQPPYEAAGPVDLKEQELAAGDVVWRWCLDRLAACLAADWWPGASPDRRKMELKPWAAGVIEEVSDG
uniref:Putative exodeoxyribonuclease 8 PDDEXK-like domain-containing protein n=1 Tax=viral metagenome TaxID=1070528 RepID=A0A6H1Z9N2_9ZZZZ